MRRRGHRYQDLRSPDARDQAEGYAPTPVVDEPSEPSGFDLLLLVQRGGVRPAPEG